MMEKTEPNWANIIPEFLAITDLSQERKIKDCRGSSSKELVLTEAKKLIRHEKFQQLGERKKEKILTREINQFRENLELNRNLNKMHLEAAEELVQLEKKHRQIRTMVSKTLTHHEIIKKPSVFEICDAQKRLKNCEKKKCEPVKKSLEPINPKVEEKPVLPIEEPKKVKVENKSKPKVHQPETQKKSQFIKNYVAHKTKLYYWTKWKIFVTVKRKEKVEEKILREKINNFMQRLHERSKHQLAPNKSEEKTVRRKTAPAKANSTNDQDLQEISEAIEKSATETRNQLRSRSVQSLHSSSKTKAKLIRLITTLTPKEEEMTKEAAIQFPTPQVLIEMNRKHEERKNRLVEIQEKKRQIEEEKDRIAKEKYELQLFEAEQEKRRKIQEFREKLRKEKAQQEKRQQEWKRLKDLNQFAIQYYERKLLLKHGLDPLLRLVSHRRIKNKEAIEFNEKRIKREQFHIWKQALQQIQNDKITKALALRAHQLFRTCFREWKGICLKRAQQLQVAQDWHELILIRDAFQAWLDFVYKEQKDHQDKWNQAVRFYRTNLLKRCLKHWMLLPQILYLEREKEHRKRAWRETVQQVLPDFKPIIKADSIFF